MIASRLVRRASVGLLALTGLVVPPVVMEAQPAAAYTATCTIIDRTYNIQEGSLDVNTAYIDITGKICRGTDGLFDGRSTLSFGIRTTALGRTMLGGSSYSIRGVTRLYFSKTDERWRVYVAYNACMAKYLPLCGPGDPQFHFDMDASITFLTYNGLHRSAITNNTYANARWS